jgi:nucleotide-binding universal stress UspA family protein
MTEFMPSSFGLDIVDREVNMYKTILVPLDGSERAEKVLPYVEELGLRCGAEVVLLHVIDPFSVVVGPEGSSYTDLAHEELERQKKEAESYLAGLGEKLSGKGIQSTSEVVAGAVVEEIMRAAQRRGADLIAMASHGRTGLARVFYGSVAAGVLHRIDRPLLLIRSRDDE